MSEFHGSVDLDGEVFDEGAFSRTTDIPLKFGHRREIAFPQGTFANIDPQLFVPPPPSPNLDYHKLKQENELLKNENLAFRRVICHLTEKIADLTNGLKEIANHYLTKLATGEVNNKDIDILVMLEQFGKLPKFPFD